jgi:CheY-like chemotaxis protein
MNATFEPTNSKSRVLIVDDNSRFAGGAQLFLEHTGNYFACAVNDPRRALETARSFKPDLVVVDLIMPQADGLEVATQLEADWALHEVPIVFVTALITPEEARGGRRINGHRVVPKPTRGFDLIRVVEENLSCCSGT